MEQLGEQIASLGLRIIPRSFAFYFPLRWFEHIWKHGNIRLVKGIWYLALGVLQLTDEVGIDILVMYICFLGAWDLFFQQKEVGLERKSDKRN